MINLMNAVTVKNPTLPGPEAKAASDRQPVSASGKSSPAAPVSWPPPPTSAETVKAAAEQVSSHLALVATSLLSPRRGLGSTVIQVKDKATDE